MLAMQSYVLPRPRSAHAISCIQARTASQLALRGQVFRESGGRAKVWGRPPKKLTAQYTTGDGTQKTSLLLMSGAALQP